MTVTDSNQGGMLRDAQRLIKSGDFQAAKSVLSEALLSDPDNQDALYFHAVSARYLGETETALRSLRSLIAIAPDYGRAYQEEGHTYTKAGNRARALLSYQRACQCNPALAASWRRQYEIYTETGEPIKASKALAQADWITSLPRDIVAAMNHLYEGRLFKAEQIARAFLQNNPKNVEGMRVLAEVASRFSVLEEAEFLLESARSFAPDNLAINLDYVRILRKRQKHSIALGVAEELSGQNPEDPVFLSQLAIDSMHNNQFDRAFELFDRVLTKIPDDPATLVSRGHALKTFGRHGDAVDAYQRAVEVAPDHGEGWFGLANLKTYRFTDQEIDKMRTQEKSDRLTYQSRIQICFSLGKALEDFAQFEEAFDYYARGNEMKRAQSRYDAADMSAELSLQKEICTAELFESRAGGGCDLPDPIFIVGLPRAGSTLLEQILASHSQVDGTQELPNILALAHRLRGRRNRTERSAYPAVLQELNDDDFRTMGLSYIEDTRMHRGAGAYFIDKMPNNFRHIGLIHLILPNAKIIDARREPMACCFSGFKQLFAEGQEFTYGLREIGQYYRDYVNLMHHWGEVLPGKVLRVQHEEVLDDLEGQVRRMLSFCDLPFERQCLDFHKTERTVKTASSEQVRKPINKAGVDQWRPFNSYLDPLRDALGPALTEYKV